MTMIERVARAGFAQAEKNARLSGYSGPSMKWETESDKLHEDWMAVARVMIEAMREPTRAMLDAAYDAADTVYEPPYPDDAWPVIIDDAITIIEQQ